MGFDDYLYRGLKPPSKEQRPVNWAENLVSRIHPAPFFRPGICAWAVANENLGFFDHSPRELL